MKQTENKSLDALLNAAVDAIIISDSDGQILRINPAGQEMFGYREAKLVGENVRTLMPQPDQDAHDGYIRKYLDGSKPAIVGIGREVTARHADDHVFPIHLSVGEITGHSRARFVAIIRDLSEQKATQETVKELEQHLAHADRLVVLGELTAGIAHEINQPLTAIAAFADAGARLLKSDSAEAKHELENIQKRIAEQARRAGNVVNRLRRLSRKEGAAKSNHHIDVMVGNVLLLFEHELNNSSIQLETHFEPGLPMVFVDEIQIQQVLVNLVKNSIDALQAAGTEKPSIRIQSKQKKQVIEVQVVDNGPGVPDEFEQKLFEPFYTTKQHGVGLGLSICKNIAVSHGGKLDYRQAKGGGACFILSIPLAFIG